MFLRIAAAVLLLGALTTPAAQAADSDVTWTVRTAANDLGSDRTGFDYHLDPGGSVQDALVVANRGDEPLTLGVYAADGYTTDAGQFDVLTGDADSAHLGSWLTTGESITVEPGATADVPFTLTVPENATPGDYVGALVTSLAQPGDEPGITVDRRLGIRIDLRVGGELAPALTVTDVQLGYHDTINPAGTGDGTVSYTLHNTGNTVISAQQEVEVSGPFGWFTVDATDLPPAPELLPGESWDVSVPVSGVVPSFRIGAAVRVVPVVTDAAGSTSALAAVPASAGTWAVPWSSLVLLVAVAGLVWWRIRHRRLRARREDERVADRVRAALAGVAD
ncbi:WxL protein peptidoglycan domain-containing protein [Cellulomonas denverensis]|uniref:DUF916 domain-containing protein n=2 Tax=Cellulomonas denverensis TaxID=264297 RepID=A0A7X6KSI0_9CELL|nr:DUF916 domain-containing protein [Cellulomonas denverensis]NKY21471.1 DUF916 domain-containing protein [Cellulomonas denverensis]GIG26983.1 hypothetical protein Cde04nite_32270 [Cellulomonas denverensis]